MQPKLSKGSIDRGGTRDSSATSVALIIICTIEPCRRDKYFCTCAGAGQ